MGKSTVVAVVLLGILLAGCDGEPNPLAPLDVVVQTDVVVLDGGVCAGDVVLHTQPDVDAFGALGCTVLEGELAIQRNPDLGPPVSTLAPLAGLSRVEGPLAILYNPECKLFGHFVNGRRKNRPIRMILIKRYI